VGDQVDIIRIPFNHWRYDFYWLWTIAPGMQGKFYQWGDAADGYEILTPRLLRAKQQVAPAFQILEFGTSLLLALCWWNIACWILVHVPMIAYHYYLTRGYNYLDDRTLLSIVWWYYKSVPWWITFRILVGLIMPCCFRPLWRRWDSFFLASYVPASTIVQ